MRLSRPFASVATTIAIGAAALRQDEGAAYRPQAPEADQRLILLEYAPQALALEAAFADLETVTVGRLPKLDGLTAFDLALALQDHLPRRSDMHLILGPDLPLLDLLTGLYDLEAFHFGASLQLHLRAGQMAVMQSWLQAAGFVCTGCDMAPQAAQVWWFQKTGAAAAGNAPADPNLTPAMLQAARLARITAETRLQMRELDLADLQARLKDSETARLALEAELQGQSALGLSAGVPFKTRLEARRRQGGEHG